MATKDIYYVSATDKLKYPGESKKTKKIVCKCATKNDALWYKELLEFEKSRYSSIKISKKKPQFAPSRYTTAIYTFR